MIRVCTQTADQDIALPEEGSANGQGNDRHIQSILEHCTHVEVVVVSFLESQQSLEYSGLSAWLELS